MSSVPECPGTLVITQNWVVFKTVRLKDKNPGSYIKQKRFVIITNVRKLNGSFFNIEIGPNIFPSRDFVHNI